MTFSGKVKQELARMERTRLCCQRAELAALIRLNGSVSIQGEGQMGLSVFTQSAATARLIFRLLRTVLGRQVSIYTRRRTRLHKKHVYMLRYRGDVPAALASLGLVGAEGLLAHGVEPEIVAGSSCRRSYLRGAFLAAGAVNDPQKSYHLEITTEFREQAQVLLELMAREDVTAKVMERKGSFVVYIKDSEQIARFLNLAGAHAALLYFEDTRIHKEVRNQVNRLVNAETANLNKTIEASIKQMEAIRLLAARQELSKLSPALRQMAELRLNNPDASLQELGLLAQPPLSKSTVNHRLRRLISLAYSKK